MQFSVIIPLYNKGKLVAEAVRSVMEQSCPDFELIIVDDGSTDDGYAVAAAFTDPRIRIIRQKNGGVSVARNSGIQNADGDYICFLDADDIWLPEHLATLKALIEKYPQAGLYATGYRIIECDGSEKTTQAESDMLTDDLFELELCGGESYLHTNSVCIPKKTFDKAGLFVPGEKLGEDTSMWMRIAAYYGVALSKTATSLYRREYSEAFTGLEIPTEWSFLKFCEDGILADTEIAQSKRDNIAKFVCQYYITICRQEIKRGNRKKARRLYRKINWELWSKKAKLVTDIYFLLPTALVGKIIDHRNTVARKKHSETAAELSCSDGGCEK